jgi:hypothetical protein
LVQGFYFFRLKSPAAPSTNDRLWEKMGKVPIVKERIMQSVGVLICGYSKEDAQAIKAFLDRTLDADVILVSASQKTDMKIIDILQKGPEDYFADEETKILMFLGFTEVQTHMVLKDFPSREGGVRRPIFCSLTAQNRQWPLHELIEHLVEEHRRWSGR